MLWLLDRAASGIALTQTGALNRALVREVATRWPSWWPADLFGAPNREDDVTLLAELHELLRRLGLLRRTGRRLTATRHARALAADPPALLRALTRPLVADDNFDAACCELAVALILNDATADYTSSLASHVYPGASPPAGTRTANHPSANTSAGRLPTSSAPPKPSACSNPHPRARAGARPVLSSRTGKLLSEGSRDGLDLCRGERPLPLSEGWLCRGSRSGSVVAGAARASARGAP
jgi:hypothetical protein